MNNTDVRIHLRRFMETHGKAIDFNGDDPDEQPNPFGWIDYIATVHVNPNNDGCAWKLHHNATLQPRSYLQHQGIGDSIYENGVNAGPADCACGQYTNRYLRHAGTIEHVLIVALASSMATDDHGTISL